MVSVGERMGLLPNPEFTLEGPDGAIRITRKSLFSGQINEMTLPIDRASFHRWRVEGHNIGTVFPDLTPMQREFLMTGATQAEWDETFPEEEEDD